MMSKLKFNFLTIIGFFLSGVYLLIVFFLVRDDLRDLSELPVNELGDFLTGAFGPVAVFWLIIGYFQQGNELKLSVKALELQAEELRRSVEQQTSIAELSREQLAHEFERHRQELNFRAASDRGVFVVTYEGSYGRSDGKTEHHFAVVNLGQSVASFSFNFGNGLQLVQSEAFDEDDVDIVYPVWERHKGRRYTFLVAGRIDENIPALELDYTNADGSVVTRAFMISLEKDGYFEGLQFKEKLD